MTVDKVMNHIGTQAAAQDRIKEAADKAKASKNDKATRAEITSEQDRVEFSDQAKQLQETEQILRFAMEKLEKYDEVRSEKLDEVRERLESDFYFGEDMNEDISQKIISPRELMNTVRDNLEVREYMNRFEEMDAVEEEIDTEKLVEIRNRVAEGYYDDPEILDKTAEKLIELLRG